MRDRNYVLLDGGAEGEFPVHFDVRVGMLNAERYEGELG